jgi:hypothetical protein
VSTVLGVRNEKSLVLLSRTTDRRRTAPPLICLYAAVCLVLPSGGRKADVITVKFNLFVTLGPDSFNSYDLFELLYTPVVPRSIIPTVKMHKAID